LGGYGPWFRNQLELGAFFLVVIFFSGTRLFSRKVLGDATRIQASQATYYPRHETEAQSTSSTQAKSWKTHCAEKKGSSARCRPETRTYDFGNHQHMSRKTQLPRHRA